MNQLFFKYSIEELIAKMRGGDLSPAEVSGAALENIRELDPKYHAWVTRADEALCERERRDNQIFGNIPDRLLEHIPVGVKDIFNTADFPTQMGSHLWKDFTPGNDARTVYNLKRQGAVVMGKTVTAEFAVHTLGETLNPYDVAKNPGTSSSGSAVAVSLGMVPAATGTQTAGSIVRPASFCGVYGCKPSFGTIPRTGTLKTTDSLDTIGFFAIHQQDLRRMFDAMRVKGLDYPISHAALSDPARQAKPASRPWRVGLARTHTWEYAPQYAKDALERFFKDLGGVKGVEILEVKLPESMEQAHAIHATIYNKALSYYFKGEHKQSDFVSPIMNQLIESGKAVTLANYTQAIKDQAKLIHEMDALFADFDVLVSLSTAGEAPLREITELPDPALMWTLTHLPVVSVPKFSSPGGMPFGLQVAARKYNDYLLFNFLDFLRDSGLIPVKAGFGLNAQPQTEAAAERKTAR